MPPEAEKPPLKARAVRFDWTHTPLHWIPGDPFATHLANGLHLIAPVAEKWFIKVYQSALPRLADERLKADVRGFMGQEGMHARAHDMVLEQLAQHGIDTAEFVARFDAACEALAGQPDWLPLPDEAWLAWQLALVAAGEQMTCVLGDWVLSAEGLDDCGADPVMLDMMRWHGAEEVEHREVAFEVLRHLSGPAEYPLRVAGMATVAPFLLLYWTLGVQDMLARDPTLKGRSFGPLDLARVIQQGRFPGVEFAAAVARYLDPAFHPAREGSLETAAAFLARSPGVSATPA